MDKRQASPGISGQIASVPGAGCVGWPGRADTRLGNQLDVQLCSIRCNGLVDQPGQCRNVGDGRGVDGEPEPAIEIPKVHPGGQWLAALTGQVFTDIVFYGLYHAVAVFAFEVQGECFLHGVAIMRVSRSVGRGRLRDVLRYARCIHPLT